MSWHRAWTQPDQSPTWSFLTGDHGQNFPHSFFQNVATVSSMELDPLAGGRECDRKANEMKEEGASVCVHACIHGCGFKYVCDIRGCMFTCIHICMCAYM